MNIGQAMSIIMRIDSDQYSDEEKGLAIYKIFKSTSRSTLLKSDLHKIIWYLLGKVFELPEENK